MPLVPVFEEIWPRLLTANAKPKFIGPVDAGDGYDAAREKAKSKVAKFDHRNFDEEFDYAWGYNNGAPELHRYVVGTFYYHVARR
jgi:hypothetical protein